MAELKAVKVFEKRYEAEMAKGLLVEQGIESMVAADDCGGQLLGLSGIRKRGIKLLVREEDLERAEEALQVLELN